MNRKKLFYRNRSLVIYTGGSIFKTAVQIIANAIMLMYIDPEHIGIYNTFALFQTYALFAQAGVTNGLNRELPFILGQGDNKKAVALTSTAFIYTVFSLFLVIIAGSILFFTKGNTYIQRISIVTIVILTTLRFYESYLVSTFRSNQAFQKLGKVFFIRGVLGIITIPLVIWFKYEGYLSRFVVTLALMLILMFLIRPIKEQLLFQKLLLLKLIKTGLPIFGLAYFFQVMNTADRFFLATLHGTEQVGYYSFGLMTYSAFKTLPITLANYIYPKFSFSLGQNRPLIELWEHAWKANASLFVIMLSFAIVGYFITPWVVNTFFPKYYMGIGATRLLLFAAVFSGATIGSNLLWSIKSWKYMIILQLLGGLFIAISVYISLRLMDNPLIASSLGVLLGQIFYFFLANTLTYIKTHE